MAKFLLSQSTQNAGSRRVVKPSCEARPRYVGGQRLLVEAMKYLVQQDPNETRTPL